MSQEMAEKHVNAVYYPSWRVYKNRPPSLLDVANITHIYYAFVSVHENGTLRRLDEWADDGKEVDGVKGCLAALAKLKMLHPHIKTLVSVGGGSSSKEFPKLACSAEATETFAKQIREFCDQYCFDGVDIDWEHPQDSEAGHNYLVLLKAIRKALPSPKYLLTTALPVGEYCLKHINLPKAANLLDFLNLMGYDFTGSWTDVSGHHAQLFPLSLNLDEVYPTLRQSVEGGVNYVLSHGFPNHKLVLGVPAYARYFGQARGPGHPFKGSGEIEYCELPDEWVARAQVDDGVVAASYVDCVGDKGFVSFDVPETVRIKSRYAKSLRLGGLFYWHGAGDRIGAQSIVAAGRRELDASGE